MLYQFILKHHREVPPEQLLPSTWLMNPSERYTRNAEEMFGAFLKSVLGPFLPATATQDKECGVFVAAAQQTTFGSLIPTWLSHHE